jgi:hypothetical protein
MMVKAQNHHLYLKRTPGLLQQQQMQVLYPHLRLHQKAVHHFDGALGGHVGRLSKHQYLWKCQQSVLSSKSEIFFKRQQIKGGI